MSYTSYAIIFKFSLSNISMPNSTDLRNSTYSHVQRSINNALNKLLNELNAETIKPHSSHLTSSGNRIKGNMEYWFQNNDTRFPIGYFRELQRQKVSSTTFPPTTKNKGMVMPASSSMILGSAVVYSKVIFKSSSPEPSERLVLSAVNSLLNSRLTNITDPLKVLNTTYKKMSYTSYAIIFKFSLSNISMPNSTDLRNSTYSHVQRSINNALNKLLNELNAETIKPHSSHLTSSANRIKGNMEYRFQNDDTRIPISYFRELQRQNDSSTTFPPTTKSKGIVMPASSSMILGSAVVYSKVIFKSSSPEPSERLVLSAVNSLLNSRLTNITDPLKVLNTAYEKLSLTSYAIIFKFSLSNISMPNSTDLRNSTYSHVQRSINNAVNTLLNEPNAEPIEPYISNLTSSANQVIGKMEYQFQNGDTRTPVSYFIELMTQKSMRTTTLSVTNTPLQSTTTSTLFGIVLIYIRVVFKNFTYVPSEAQVLAVANAQLDSSIRTNQIPIQNITYQEMDSNSFTISFEFKISNVTMAMNNEQRNETYDLIDHTVNDLMNKILNIPEGAPFVFPQTNYIDNNTLIVATAEYIYARDDIKSPSGFIARVLSLGSTTTPATTAMHFPTVHNTINPGNSTSIEGTWWVLAIVIPCVIAIIFIPCLILLCCLLCGWCADLRRRYSRRRSHSIQYISRNGLF
ncbi:uncharacterized protein LOC143490933 [Brachyhypopomus gauderio]|uniref:uncharacterized protein LOC143490933 n=1 Tax=Brachyhypopomus gauderio TaxID=698409 RepID=UPI00404223A8